MPLPGGAASVLRGDREPGGGFSNGRWRKGLQLDGAPVGGMRWQALPLLRILLRRNVVQECKREPTGDYNGGTTDKRVQLHRVGVGGAQRMVRIVRKGKQIMIRRAEGIGDCPNGDALLPFATAGLPARGCVFHHQSDSNSWVFSVNLCYNGMIAARTCRKVFGSSARTAVP